MKTKAKQIVRAIKRSLLNALKKHLVYIAEDTVHKKNFALTENINSLSRYAKLYFGITEKIKVRRKLMLNYKTRVKKLSESYGLVIGRNYSTATPGNALTVPDFIDLSIKLPSNIDDFYNGLPNTARYDVRKIEHSGFKWMISTDVNWVNTFYHSYYKPSMQIRHGDEAFIMAESNMLDMMKTGNYEFLKVYDGTTCVAVVFAKIETDKYHYFKVGWLNGDNNLIKNGATAAMYWFTVKRAFQLNIPEVVLGGTPAYLENGVFRYKAKWLAGFSKKKYGLNQLFLNPDNPLCYRFLQQVSPIAINKNGEIIVLSAKSKDKAGVTGCILNEMDHWYILRDKKANSYDENVSDLPDPLRYWYQKIA